MEEGRECRKGNYKRTVMGYIQVRLHKRNVNNTYYKYVLIKKLPYIRNQRRNSGQVSGLFFQWLSDQMNLNEWQRAFELWTLASSPSVTVFLRCWGNVQGHSSHTLPWQLPSIPMPWLLCIQRAPSCCTPQTQVLRGWLSLEVFTHTIIARREG